MEIFVEWWSGKTIKLEVAACYTIDTVKAKILAQEGTPLDEQRLIWFGESLPARFGSGRLSQREKMIGSLAFHPRKRPVKERRRASLLVFRSSRQ